MPANQVSGAVGYLVGSATALALSIGPEAAPAGGVPFEGLDNDLLRFPQCAVRARSRHAVF